VKSANRTTIRWNIVNHDRLTIIVTHEPPKIVNSHQIHGGGGTGSKSISGAVRFKDNNNRSNHKTFLTHRHLFCFLRLRVNNPTKPYHLFRVLVPERTCCSTYSSDARTTHENQMFNIYPVLNSKECYVNRISSPTSADPKIGFYQMQFATNAFSDFLYHVFKVPVDSILYPLDNVLCSGSSCWSCSFRGSFNYYTTWFVWKFWKSRDLMYILIMYMSFNVIFICSIIDLYMRSSE
jgi:hypothetical protein